MVELTKIVDQFEISSQSKKKRRKEIIAEVIDEYLNSHSILFEREIQLYLEVLHFKTPSHISLSDISTLAKPATNEYIRDKFAIKYITSKDAILKAVQDDRSNLDRIIAFNWEDTKQYRITRSGMQQFGKSLIFYKDERLMLQEIAKYLQTETVVRCTFKMPAKAAVPEAQYRQ